jgi:trimeric autotransporter adhesin
METKTTTCVLLFVQIISVGTSLTCESQTTPGQMSKMWFNMESASGAFSQTLLAYSNFTTDGLDFGYDGTLLNDGIVALYTKVGNTKLMIQAKGEFEITDTEPLHYRANYAGEYAIKLHNKTGIFANGQNVYIRDNQNNTIHDFITGAYTFTTDAGTNEGRFDIIYTLEEQPSLTIEKLRLTSNTIMAYTKGNALIIETPGIQISDLYIHDLHGRTIYQNKHVDAESTAVQIAAQQQMLIVQITSTQGVKTSKKVIY